VVRPNGRVRGEEIVLPAPRVASGVSDVVGFLVAREADRAGHRLPPWVDNRRRSAGSLGVAHNVAGSDDAQGRQFVQIRVW